MRELTLNEIDEVSGGDIGSGAATAGGSVTGEYMVQVLRRQEARVTVADSVLWLEGVRE